MSIARDRYVVGLPLSKIFRRLGARVDEDPGRPKKAWCSGPVGDYDTQHCVLGDLV